MHPYNHHHLFVSGTWPRAFM